MLQYIVIIIISSSIEKVFRKEPAPYTVRTPVKNKKVVRGDKHKHNSTTMVQYIVIIIIVVTAIIILTQPCAPAGG